MNVPAHYRSLTSELEALKDRVRNFIDDHHWLTDGEWKESVLRSIISQRLPDTVKIGRGFVMTETGPTTQCDILLYRADRPVLFRQGDLAFVTADAALAIIEVKSKATKHVFCKAVRKLGEIGQQLGSNREHCCLGLFAYDSAIRDHSWLLDAMQAENKHRSQVVNFVNLGCSTFIRWWEFSPSGGDEHYERWHSYELKNMSAGYFVANVLDEVSPGSIGSNSGLWFPEDPKEFHVTGTRPHAAALPAASPPPPPSSTQIAEVAP